MAPSVVRANQISGSLMSDRPTTMPENMAAHRYMSSTLCRCEWPMLSSRWCRCCAVRVERRHAARVRRITASSRSVYGMSQIATGQQQRQDGREPVDRVQVRVVDQDVLVERSRARDRAVGEQQAEQHRPGVAHEDPRGVEVVRQEPDADARQHRRRHRGHRLRRDADRVGQRVGVDQVRERRDADDAGRETVEAVDEVHRVDRDDDDQDRQRVAQVRLEQQRLAARPAGSTAGTRRTTPRCRPPRSARPAWRWRRGPTGRRRCR